MSVVTIGAGALALAFGVGYKFVQPLLTVTAGFGRHLQNIEDFPYTCRKLVHPSLEACEDIFLDEVGRKAYLACSAPLSRKEWMPAVDRFNPKGRSENDHFAVLDLDSPGTDGLHGLYTLSTPGFVGVSGKNVIDLHGFDVEDLGDDKLKFYVINHRPPVDAAGEYLDAVKLGSNSTVEIFEHTRGSKELIHKETYFNEHIYTPNRLTADHAGGFVVVNDKSARAGFRRHLDLAIGGGNLVHCKSGTCIRANSDTLAFPNGLDRSHVDGHFYVPSTADGNIYVYSQSPTNVLTRIDVIKTGYPVDNVHIDANGDIWAASFPKLFDLLSSFDHPLEGGAVSAATRSRKTENGWVVKKVLEDAEAKVLPSATSVVHDTKTGRLFLGSVLSPWVTVCDQK